jgi:hypothetical protein
MNVDDIANSERMLYNVYVFYTNMGVLFTNLDHPTREFTFDDVYQVGWGRDEVITYQKHLTFYGYLVQQLSKSIRVEDVLTGRYYNVRNLVSYVKERMKAFSMAALDPIIYNQALIALYQYNPYFASDHGSVKKFDVLRQFGPQAYSQLPTFARRAIKARYGPALTHPTSPYRYGDLPDASRFLPYLFKTRREVERFKLYVKYLREGELPFPKEPFGS